MASGSPRPCNSTALAGMEADFALINGLDRSTLAGLPSDTAGYVSLVYGDPTIALASAWGQAQLNSIGCKQIACISSRGRLHCNSAWLVLL